MAPSTRSRTARSKATSSKRQRFEVTVDVPVKRRAAAGKCKRLASFIDSLCNEVFVNVLELLSWQEIMSCRLTCKQWNFVILSSPTLWMSPPPIEDSVTEIVRRMTGPLCTLSGGGRFRTLALILDPIKVDADQTSNTYQPKEKTEANLASCFPSATLRELNCVRTNNPEFYDAAESSVSNTELWQCVTLCSQLKILRWLSTESRHGYSSLIGPIIDYCINGTPLAQCRLEEFTFACPYEPNIDDAFIRTLSQVKRLYIKSPLSPSDCEKIFDTIKDVVEEFTYANYSDNFPGRNVLDAIKAKRLTQTIEMPRLKRFNAAHCLSGSEFSRHQMPSPFQVIAPLVTCLSFSRLNSIDWVLLESCRSTLESFCIGTGGEELPDRLRKELFNMPALVDLAIDLQNDHNRDYRCNPGFSLFEFWKAIDQGDTGRSDIPIQDVLPRLKSLTIIDDTELSLKRITGLFKLRHRLGLTPIESLSLWFEHEIPLSTEDIEELKSQVPKLEIIDRATFYDNMFCDMRCNRHFILKRVMSSTEE